MSLLLEQIEEIVREFHLAKKRPLVERGKSSPFGGLARLVYLTDDEIAYLQEVIRTAERMPDQFIQTLTEQTDKFVRMDEIERREREIHSP